MVFCCFLDGNGQAFMPHMKLKNCCSMQQDCPGIELQVHCQKEQKAFLHEKCTLVLNE